MKKELTETRNTINRRELLNDGTDVEFRQFVHDALAFSVRLLAVREGYGKIMGITGPQYTILISVVHLSRQGTVSVSQISKHLHLSGSFVTSETKKMVKEKLIRKTGNPLDKRSIDIEVTDDGRRRLAELASIQAEVNDVHFSPLTRKSFRLMKDVLPLLVDSTDEALSLLMHLNKINHRR